MNKHHICDRQSELISDLVAQLKSHRSTLVSGLGNVWNHLIYNCIRYREPQIWQKRDDRTGETWYRVYDPITGRSAHCSTDNDVRAWLDKLPY